MDFDVIVAGAGPAGSLVARDLARSGFSVGLFDRSPREKLGKPVIVEVERHMFSRVGLSLPTEEEVPYHPERIHVFSPRNVKAYEVDSVPMVSLYLDRFAGKLLQEAEEAGAHFFGGYRAQKPLQNGRDVFGAVFLQNRRKAEVRARLVIDATGFEAALVRKLHPDSGIVFTNDSRDVVLAANYLHDIHPDKALQAVRQGLHGDEELWVRIGLFGSYSTEFSHLSIRKKRAYILIGLKADNEGIPIDKLIRHFRKRQGYYGKRLHGGKGSIRIRHTLDRLVSNGFLAIGEAGCMVLPINGSGVSSALLSAHLAAQTAANAMRNSEPSTEALWSFATRYHRTRGSVLAAFDAMRLTTEALNRKQVASMLESGLSGPEDFINASVVRLLPLSPTLLARRVKSLALNPDLLKPMLRAATLTLAIHRHYRRYPATYEPAEFDRWREKTRKLFGSIP